MRRALGRVLTTAYGICALAAFKGIARHGLKERQVEQIEPQVVFLRQGDHRRAGHAGIRAQADRRPHQAAGQDDIGIQPWRRGKKSQQTQSGAEGETQSYLDVPIIVGENVNGVVTVQSHQENAYQASHVSLLSTLASSMGVAIANARLFKAEQERVAELEIINSIQKGLAAELDFQAIVDLVGDKLREVFQTGNLGSTWAAGSAV